SASENCTLTARSGKSTMQCQARGHPVEVVRRSPETSRRRIPGQMAQMRRPDLIDQGSGDAWCQEICLLAADSMHLKAPAAQKRYGVTANKAARAGDQNATR